MRRLGKFEQKEMTFKQLLAYLEESKEEIYRSFIALNYKRAMDRFHHSYFLCQLCR